MQEKCKSPLKGECHIVTVIDECLASNQGGTYRVGVVVFIHVRGAYLVDLP